jgi:hypothetical protein
MEESLCEKKAFPKLVQEVLQIDKEYFGMKGETLFNLIVEELGFEKGLELGLDTVDEKKSILFTLNEKNTKLFPDMLKLSHVDDEGVFLKNLFITYANLHPSIRQKILFKHLFMQLEQAIKKKKKIKIYYQGNLWEIIGIALERDISTGYSFLRAKTKDKEYQFEVKYIEYIA